MRSIIINPLLISIGVTRLVSSKEKKKKKHGRLPYSHPKHGNRSQLIHPITVNNTRNTHPRRYRVYKKGVRIDSNARGMRFSYKRAKSITIIYLPPILFSHTLSANQSERSSCAIIVITTCHCRYNILDGRTEISC